MGILTYVLSFFVVIGILVTIHEFGHFWVARRVGVKVLSFSIGFGKPLFKWYGKDGVEYRIARWPLGGYVKMLGEVDEDIAESDKPYSFAHQSLPKRTAVVVAGPLANFILAIIVYWIVFMLGITGVKPVVGNVETGSIAFQAGLQSGETIIKVDQQITPTWGETILALIGAALRNKPVELETSLQGVTYHHTLSIHDAEGILGGRNLFKVLGFDRWQPKIQPSIAEVVKDSRADQAGFQAGDLVLSADGEIIDSWQSWVKYVSERPETLMKVKVKRNDITMTLSLTPKKITIKDKTFGQAGLLGYIPEEIKQQLRGELKYAPIPAMGAAFDRTWDVSVLTLRMFGKMIMGQASLKNISGPISIAQYAGDSANLGVVPFLIFLAIVSISLGVINLLPIPMLDGGHLLYYAIEAIKGAPVSDTVLFFGQRVGITLLLMLMSLAFYNDLARILG